MKRYKQNIVKYFFDSLNIVIKPILLIFLYFPILITTTFSQTTIDQQTYNYNTSNNELTSITDTKSIGLSLDDIDNQNVNNYLHNANGQLTQDEAEGIVDIQWAVSGKVRKVFIDDDNDGTVDRTLSFLYDAMGFRVKKTETVLATITSPAIVSHTFYSRNATGGLVALYEKDESENIKRKEVSISIGSDKTEVDPTLVASSTTTDVYTRTLANKYFELKDQLGTVRTVINNVKEDDGTGNFKAVITSTSDNYAFGMELPSRTFITNEARYGFQGYEKDNELKGNGKSYITEARLYDPRIGRWQSPDPLEYKFPSLSSYNFCENNPIIFIDPNGMAAFLAISLGADVAYRGKKIEKISKAYHSDFRVRHHHSSYDMFDPWAHKKAWDNLGISRQEELIFNALINASNDPEGISFLAVFSHGTAGGLYDHEGDDLTREDIDNKLIPLIKSGDIKFNEEALIYLGGCNLGTTYGEGDISIAQQLANVSGASVIASVNSKVSPKNEKGDNMEYESFEHGGGFYLFRPGQKPEFIGKTVDLKKLYNNQIEQVNQRRHEMDSDGNGEADMSVESRPEENMSSEPN